MKRTYTVRIAKPVFKTIAIEVEAWSEGSAIRKAASRAVNLPETEWSVSDKCREDYTMHVEAVLNHEHVYETDPNPRQRIAAFKAANEPCDTTRYVLLAGSMETGTGRFLVQPWFNRSSSVLQTELCSDWAEPISFIIENDGIEGDEDAAKVDDLHVHLNVIEFPSVQTEEEASSQS